MAERNLNAEDVRRLYEQHGPALLLYARSILRDAAAGEDVVHQVFLRLMRGDTAIPDMAIAYLYRAVRNTALNVRRNLSKEAPLGTGRLWFHDSSGIAEAALTLQAALQELPEEQRETVIMRIWSGMTLEEVAASTSVSLNTAASRYRYAIEKLRERLKAWQPQGGDECPRRKIT